MIIENSFNSNNEALAKRKEIEERKATEERVRKEKAYLKKERNRHIDNVVYTIHHNREVGKSNDILEKYEITYIELVAGLKRVYKINNWSEYLKSMKKTFEAEKLFDFRANTVPRGKIVARSDKFKSNYAKLSRGGVLTLVNERNLSIKNCKYHTDSYGNMVARIFSGNGILVANLMWKTFKDKNMPLHTIIGYKDNDKGNLKLDNLYIKRKGVS